MCGESRSANSAASLTTPRQSALGFPDVGGGEGQPRNGDSRTATASTSTVTSNTTGIAAGPGRLTAPASRPCMPGGYPPAATHNPGQPPRPAQRYEPGAHAAAPPWPATPSPAASPAGTPTGSRTQSSLTTVTTASSNERRRLLYQGRVRSMAPRAAFSAQTEAVLAALAAQP